MDINQMKNIVILRNIPSNIVEEAIVVLKSNTKVKQFKTLEGDKSSFNNCDNKKVDQYIVKEAEDVIAHYIENVENKKNKKVKNIAKK